MQVGERHPADERERRAVIFLGLPGESGDRIRANRRVREPLAHQLRAPRVVFGAIPPVHRRQNAVRSRLQRHMEVLCQAAARREQSD